MNRQGSRTKYEVTISYSNEKPSSEEITRLQNDVKQILLANFHDMSRKKVQI